MVTVLSNKTQKNLIFTNLQKEKVAIYKLGVKILTLNDAGWSSMAARRAHNPKVVGSNPAPATN